MRIERPGVPKTTSLDSKSETKKTRGAEFKLQRDVAGPAAAATTGVAAKSVIARDAGEIGKACEAPYSKLATTNDAVLTKLQAERRSMITASLRDPS